MLISMHKSRAEEGEKGSRKDLERDGNHMKDSGVCGGCRDRQLFAPDESVVFSSGCELGS